MAGRTQCLSVAITPEQRLVTLVRDDVICLRGCYHAPLMQSVWINATRVSCQVCFAELGPLAAIATSGCVRSTFTCQSLCPASLTVLTVCSPTTAVARSLRRGRHLTPLHPLAPRPRTRPCSAHLQRPKQAPSARNETLGPLRRHDAGSTCRARQLALRTRDSFVIANFPLL